MKITCCDACGADVEVWSIELDQDLELCYHCETCGYEAVWRELLRQEEQEECGN